MRVLSLVALIALVSSCEAASAVSNSDKVEVAKLDSGIASLSRALAEHNDQIKRSLRRHDYDELAEVDSGDGERMGGAQLIDDVITKVDDVVTKATVAEQKLPSKWTSALKKFRLANPKTPMQIVRAKYPKGLSSSTMRQLVQTEIQRADDIANGVKMVKTGEYKMQRQIDEFPGMKNAPLLTSNTGRADQMLDGDNSRLLACIVASRSVEKGGGDVLLVSSSNARKNDWLLPKGGWDKGETVEHAAMRELIEEGGVGGTIMHSLGETAFKNALEPSKGYVYNSFWMKADDIFDQWPESIRYRIWVSFDDAEKMLKKRPQMAEIVKATKEKAALVKTGDLPAMDDTLSKLKFEP
uniref:RxLR effector protein n=2 Tax=Phytophthora ramorum TaxID=164328 RepID=H3H674_PHYRM